MSDGLIFAILSPILSSIATIFESAATKALNPYIVASLASLIGAFFLFPYLLFKKKGFSIKEILDNKKDLLLLIFSRLVIGKLLFTIGLGLTTGVKAIFFTKTEPYFVLLWFWLLNKESVKPKHMILLSIHIAGVALLSTAGDLGDFGRAQVGDLFIVAAMAMYSLSYYPASNLTKKIGASQTNFIALFAGGLILLPAAILFSGKEILRPSIGWLYLAADALIFTTIGLTLWFASLKTVRGWMVSALRAVGPLFGLPFAYFVFKEALSPIQFLGAVIVLITSIMIAREHLRTVKK